MNIIYPVLIFISTLGAGILLRRILLSRLDSHCHKTASKIDDIVIDALKGPSYLWCLMVAIYSALVIIPAAGLWVDRVGKLLTIVGIFSITLAASQIGVNLIGAYSAKSDGMLPGASLIQNITRVAIFVVGLLIILNQLGISIAPIIATLGIGGLAVALALQDTLANMFAGFYIIIARQIRIGDYIKLDTGDEGYVSDVTWRTTRIKMLSNNEILIPNAKLGQSVVVNYHLPDRELAVTVEVGVHYDSDLDRVEKVTLEVARDVLKNTPGAVSDFEPVVRYNKLADFSVNFTVVLRAREFSDQPVIRHEFIKALHRRYKQESIAIPYPVTALNLSQEKASIR